MEQFAVVRKLTKPGGGIAETFDRLRDLLATSELRGILCVQLLEKSPGIESQRQELCFVVKSDGKKSSVTTKRPTTPDVELIMTPEVWLEIAAGNLAPHVAFFKGMMRVRGKFGLAQDMLRHVAGSDGRTHICHGVLTRRRTGTPEKRRSRGRSK